MLSPLLSLLFSTQLRQLMNVIRFVVNLKSGIHIAGQLNQRSCLEPGGQAAGGRFPCSVGYNLHGFAARLLSA